jgi:hypothetical protein
MEEPQYEFSAVARRYGARSVLRRICDRLHIRFHFRGLLKAQPRFSLQRPQNHFIEPHIDL